jgi:hypothetical protein
VKPGFYVPANRWRSIASAIRRSCTADEVAT